jgi:hypothetical protein
MTRLLSTFSVALTAALTGLGGATVVAQAEPPPPCYFTLSAPQLIQVSGATVVTATLTPDKCDFPGTPVRSVACLQVQGEMDTRCMQSTATDTAQVYYAPYRPGATYVSTGRGCGGWVNRPPAPRCDMLGPYTARL